MSLHPHAAQVNLVTGMMEEHSCQLMWKKEKQTGGDGPEVW